MSQVGTCLSLAFGTDDMTFTGMATGSVIVWAGPVASRIIERAHSGPVFAMFTTLKDGLIVTGGKEKSQKGALKLWDSQMSKCKSFTVPIENDLKKGLTVKAVCRVKGKIAIGTKDNAVALVNEKSSSGITTFRWKTVSRFCKVSDNHIINIFMIVTLKNLNT